MTDAEQIEAWQEEFWRVVEKSPDSIRNSDYNMIRLEGFLMAKRSQPVIEISSYDMHHYAPVRNIIAQLTAAGYKYKVKS